MNICLCEFQVRGILNKTISELWIPVKPQPLWIADPNIPFKLSTCNPKGIIKSPFGPIRTRIVGKETFAFCEAASLCKPGHINKDAQEHWIKEKLLWYRADSEQPNIGETLVERINGRGRWKPSIHMPPWASRITLINAGVECKPVRDITEEEAKAAINIPWILRDYFGNEEMASFKETFNAIWNKHYPKYPFESAWAWKLKFEAEVKN